MCSVFRLPSRGEGQGGGGDGDGSWFCFFSRLRSMHNAQVNLEKTSHFQYASRPFFFFLQ